MKPDSKILQQFGSKNVVIIGDLMLDKYIFGNVDRISPEAPIPVVAVTAEKYVPGGAANVAVNVSTLGGNAHLLGVVGNDTAKHKLLESIAGFKITADGIITNKDKSTIQKVRVIGHNQQLLRIDYEDTKYTDTYIKGQFVEILEKIEHISAVIVSDYAKGTITMEFMKNLQSFIKDRDIPLIIDPKPVHKEMYKDAFLITPNKKEVEALSGIKIQSEADIEKAGKKLMQELNSNVIITLGDKGMAVFTRGKEIVHIDTVAKEVYDVSGAGDTAVASLGLAIGAGADLIEAAKIANAAAGIKVGKVGTAPVYLKELSDGICQ